MDDRTAYVALNLLPGIRSVRLRAVLEMCGSPQAVLQASEEQLRRAAGIGAQLARTVVAERGRCIDRALAECRAAERQGIRVMTVADTDYPTLLRTIADPPVVLYMRGSLVTQDERAVAIVGSRLASLYGQRMAQRLAADLAGYGVTVVSGLARGIDGCAHRGAIEGAGRTIAVLGSGLLRCYPSEHVGLAGQIAAHGAVVSEFPLETDPHPGQFPRRNRLISGLSQGVVVVEAGSRSGSLITADAALDQGREVFAVPGQADAATSRGTHELLKDGARLVTCAEDVLEECGWLPRPRRAARSSPEVGGLPSSTAEEALGAWLTDEPVHVDVLCQRADMPAERVSGALLELELAGVVRRLPGQWYLRA